MLISIHALLAESDDTLTDDVSSSGRFLSTLSLRRATHYDNYNLHCVEISIHALLAESDPLTLLMVVIPISFLSTLSLRRATRRASRQHPAGEISIHALLAESDSRTKAIPAEVGDFYPRSPCGERPTDMRQRLTKLGFLSTLSLRRATDQPGG